ncbi:MAG: amidohydrolase [Clostridiales bacterium]|nr:amidohydrolase [Clostridiales bacterium]
MMGTKLPKKIIDFHVHTFADKIAPRAISSLVANSGYPHYTDGTNADTIEKFKSWGVTHGVVLPIATKATQQRTINDWAAGINEESLILFGSVYPYADDSLDELSYISSLGLKGIKLHPDYQDFFLDDERLLPLFRKCAELNLIVVLHMGFDCYSPNVRHATPCAAAKLIDRVPNLKLVLAHLGGYLHWDEVESLLVGKNVYLDTAFICDDITAEQATRIIKNHGDDKILLASDCPWHRTTDELNFIMSLPISMEAKENICYKNAEKLLNL